MPAIACATILSRQVAAGERLSFTLSSGEPLEVAGYLLEAQSISAFEDESADFVFTEP